MIKISTMTTKTNHGGSADRTLTYEEKNLQVKLHSWIASQGDWGAACELLDSIFMFHFQMHASNFPDTPEVDYYRQELEGYVKYYIASEDFFAFLSSYRGLRDEFGQNLESIALG